jgi:hypothetical protein
MTRTLTHNVALVKGARPGQIRQALDYETRETGVKVSVIAPGGVHAEFALGTGRTAADPVLHGMMEPEDIAEAVMLALTQPEKARTFLIGMRHMSEPLSGSRVRFLVPPIDDLGWPTTTRWSKLQTSGRPHLTQ